MTMAAKPVRLAVAAQFPIHYHLPLYRAMAADPGIVLDVLFMQRAWSESGYDPEVGKIVDWGAQPFEGYPYRVFPNVSPARDGEGFWKFINPGLIWRILTGPYDAVYIHGHNYLSHILCMIAARLGGKRLVLRVIACNMGERTPLKNLIRGALYRLLYLLPRVFLSIGLRNREYYRDFGVSETRLVHTPHIVDNDYFSGEAARLAGRTDALKREFGLEPADRVVLVPAKIRSVKQPLRMIEAFARAELGPGWVLLMVGDGPLRHEAETCAARYPEARIVFTGFLDQSRMPRAYAVADFVVLPSRLETWGLVINEAFNFALPAIVSDTVSCAPDLVDNKGGLVFAHDDTQALTDAIRRMATDDALRRNFQAQAEAVIKDYSVAAYMAGLRAALGLS